MRTHLAKCLTQTPSSDDGDDEESAHLLFRVRRAHAVSLYSIELSKMCLFI